MRKVFILLFAVVLLFIGLTQHGCQTFSKTKKNDPYGKNFQREVAEDPFPNAGM